MVKNKVLVYKPDLLPYSETFIKEQVLAYQRWQGVLVGHRRVPNGLPLDGLDVRLLLNDPPGQIEELRWRLRRWLDLVSRAEVRCLAAENAQLFHAHFGTVAVDIWPLVRALRLPMVVTLHGFDINVHREWWEAGHGGLRMRSYPRKLLALAQQPQVHFIAVSEAIRKRAIEYGIPADKITVCYIGVDTDRFKPGGLPITQRPRRVLFVGRLVENKGVAYLIQAFAKVVQDIPDADLVIVGDGPLRAWLEKQAQKIGHIEFLGALSCDQVKRQMDSARVLCLPSITIENGQSEGFGIVLLEAQACGVPVITSSLGAESVSLLDGESGFFFREGDVDMLEKNIRSLLANDIKTQEMAKIARNFVCEKFNIIYHVSLLESQYHKIICGTSNNAKSICSLEKVKFIYRKKEIEITGYSKDDHIYKIIKKLNSFYEIDLLEYIRLIFIFNKRMKNGIIFDVGANIGNHAIYFYKYLTKNVICFEPNTLVTPILKRNFILNGTDIKIYELALGEREEFATIRLPNDFKNIGAAKIDKAKDSNSVQGSSDKIQIVRLDDILKDIMKRFDGLFPFIIKADIEGMEPEMLLGAVDTLSFYRPHLFLEAPDCAALHKIENILCPLGYKKVAFFASTPVYHFSPKKEYFKSKILSYISKSILYLIKLWFFVGSCGNWRSVPHRRHL